MAERAPVDPATRTSKRVVNRFWYILLIAPFIGTLTMPFYAHAKPELWGFPFFYWYQFLWVIIAVAITAVVYALTTTSDAPPPQPPSGGTGVYPAAPTEPAPGRRIARPTTYGERPSRLRGEQ
jgi:hypothetical protein